MTEYERQEIVDVITRAQTLSALYHSGQRYGYQPYTYHLMQVAQMVQSQPRFDYYRDYAVFATAFLHDIVEDTTYTEEALRMDFPEEVADAVMLLTKDDTCKTEEGMVSYINRIRNNPIALRVKLADAMCNLTESYKGDSLYRIHKYATLITRLTNKEGA